MRDQPIRRAPVATADYDAAVAAAESSEAFRAYRAQWHHFCTTGDDRERLDLPRQGFITLARAEG